MTRKEYGDCILTISDQLCSEEQMNALLDLKVYISELEARIAELEVIQAPMSCDGCVYETANNGCKLYPCGLYCERFIGSIDRYEPKDS
jgi:hypothetical protein